MQMTQGEILRSRTIAGVVTFHPDRENLLRTVAQVTPHVAAMVIYANSPIDAGFEQELRGHAGSTPLLVVCPGQNLGLGTAYNAFIEIAPRFAAEYVLLLDQDSTPPAGMVPRLETAFRALNDAGEKPAAIGPQPVTASGERFKVPRRGLHNAASGATPSDFIISSGSLVSLEAAQAVGGFREDFFIDAIDIEWCYRAWHHGWSIWIADHVPMVHELGQGVIAIPFGLKLTDQPPRRLYTYIRNQIAMLRLSHVPARRKAATLAYLPFQCAVYSVRNRFSQSILKAIGAGFAHGLTNNLGAPQKTWNWITGSKYAP